jgi:hypothetical protein
MAWNCLQSTAKKVPKKNDFPFHFNCYSDSIEKSECSLQFWPRFSGLEGIEIAFQIIWAFNLLNLDMDSFKKRDLLRRHTWRRIAIAFNEKSPKHDSPVRHQSSIASNFNHFKLLIPRKTLWLKSMSWTRNQNEIIPANPISCEWDTPTLCVSRRRGMKNACNGRTPNQASIIANLIQMRQLANSYCEASLGNMLESVGSFVREKFLSLERLFTPYPSRRSEILHYKWRPDGYTR